MSIKKLFLTWQNPETYDYFPIGMLTSDGEYYYFTYTKGVKKAQLESNFYLLHSFPKIDRVYQSKNIFPLFKNRLMPSSRPDYPQYIEWLNFSQSNPNFMDILARSEGRKVTDTFQVFPEPENNNGFLKIHFFAHGLRYMPTSAQDYISNLETNIQLFVTKDCQNQYDSNALLLKTKENHNLGYIPRYLTKNIVKLLAVNSQSVRVCVEKINPAPTPIQLRLLCNLTAPWDENFLNEEDYQPIVDYSFLLSTT